MGYYTRFELGFDADRSDSDSVRNFINDLSNGKRFGQYDLSLDDSHWDTMKWYHHEDDVRALSRDYPNLLLVLSGVGEEPGDYWRKYFMNGSMVEVKGKIVYSEPDYSRLPRRDRTAERKAALGAEKARLLAEKERIEWELDSLG